MRSGNARADIDNIFIGATSNRELLAGWCRDLDCDAAVFCLGGLGAEVDVEGAEIGDNTDLVVNSCSGRGGTGVVYLFPLLLTENVLVSWGQPLPQCWTLEIVTSAIVFTGAACTAVALIKAAASFFPGYIVEGCLG